MMDTMYLPTKLIEQFMRSLEENQETKRLESENLRLRALCDKLGLEIQNFKATISSLEVGNGNMRKIKEEKESLAMQQELSISGLKLKIQEQAKVIEQQVEELEAFRNRNKKSPVPQ